MFLFVFGFLLNKLNVSECVATICCISFRLSLIIWGKINYKSFGKSGKFGKSFLWKLVKPVNWFALSYSINKLKSYVLFLRKKIVFQFYMEENVCSRKLASPMTSQPG